MQDLQELKWHVHLETRTLNKVLGELKLVGKLSNKDVCVYSIIFYLYAVGKNERLKNDVDKMTRDS